MIFLCIFRTARRAQILLWFTVTAISRIHWAFLKRITWLSTTAQYRVLHRAQAHYRYIILKSRLIFPSAQRHRISCLLSVAGFWTAYCLQKNSQKPAPVFISLITIFRAAARSQVRGCIKISSLIQILQRIPYLWINSRTGQQVKLFNIMVREYCPKWIFLLLCLISHRWPILQIKTVFTDSTALRQLLTRPLSVTRTLRTIASTLQRKCKHIPHSWINFCALTTRAAISPLLTRVPARRLIRSRAGQEITHRSFSQMAAMTNWIFSTWIPLLITRHSRPERGSVGLGRTSI